MKREGQGESHREEEQRREEKRYHSGYMAKSNSMLDER